MNRRGANMDLIAFGGFVVVILAIFFLFSGDPHTPLRRSATGFDGLSAWLNEQGIEARTFRGRYYFQEEQFGLRILPLYDTDLTRSRTEPTDETSLIFQNDERDQRERVIEEKITTLPTLLILPKWRSGFRLTRVAHPLLLADVTAVRRIAKQVPVGLGALSQPEDFTELFPYRSEGGETYQAQLYAAQLFSSKSCRPIIGGRDRLLLGECAWDGEADAPIYILTDPDLVNNHGLALGDNAAIAVSFIREIAGGKEVLIDYSNGVWISQGRTAPPRPERTWSDLGAYFQPPFTALWVSIVIALALTLWRAGVRFGAPVASTETAPAAAKHAAIEAKARLLRLGGHDAALLAAQVDQRLAAVAADIFGPHTPVGAAPLAALCGFLERRGATEASHRLANAASNIDGGSLADAPARLREFESILGEVQREFGRTARHG